MLGECGASSNQDPSFRWLLDCPLSPGDDPAGELSLGNYFLAGSAGFSSGFLSMRSILASARSFWIISACALRCTKVSIWSLTFSNSGDRLGALVLDLDDVPAELRLHRIGQSDPCPSLKATSANSGTICSLVKIAEIAALGRRTGVLRLLLGDRGEIAALLQVGENRFRLVFALDQDVTGVHLLLAADLLDRFVVDLAHGVVGEGGLAFAAAAAPPSAACCARARASS